MTNNSKTNIKIALIQLRNDRQMLEQEFRGILRSGHLSHEQVKRINGLHDTFTHSDLHDVHALIIGGSGEYSVFDELPFAHELEKSLKYCRRVDFPVIGDCWGGQFIAQVFGGEVVTDIERQEVGSYKVTTTEHTKKDPLFYDAPASFWAQIGHHESVVTLPDGAINLISSERCEIQAFTWPDSRIYGFQMHPDINKKELIERIIHYREEYASDSSYLNGIIDKAQESPYTDNMIAKFIDRIVRT